MPASIVKLFSEKTGKSIQDVETLWDKAKVIVKKEYPKVKETDDNFYQIVTGVLKKMLGLSEDVAAPAMTTTTMGDYQYRKKVFFQKRFTDKKSEKFRKKKKSQTVATFDPPFTNGN